MTKPVDNLQAFMFKIFMQLIYIIVSLEKIVLFIKKVALDNMNSKEKIRQLVDNLIEQELLRQVEIVKGIKDSVRVTTEIIESPYAHGNFLGGESLRPALDILIPKLLISPLLNNQIPNRTEDVEKIMNACQFAGDYYSIRDNIHYSFALPDTITWIQHGNHIQIKVTDHTIFRQLAAEHQSFAMNSSENKNKKIEYQNILELLRGTVNWDSGDEKVKRAMEIISEELEVKLAHITNDIPPTNTSEMGGYTYADFYKVYTTLLYIALYERAYSASNNISCVITYNQKILAEKVSENTNVKQQTCQIILKDISSSSRGTFIQVNNDEEFYLLPFSFSLKDGIGAILRQYAKRNSDIFSAQFGNIIGNSLVDKTAGYFNQYRNFRVLRDVPLTRFGKHFPDIDLIAVSYEPSLGFHFFISEIKNSLPATWGKDYLKSVGKKGYIEKALSQMKLIKEFLHSVEGIQMLKDIVIQLFGHLEIKKLFPTGFCILIDSLIITAQTIGIFYPDVTLTIINNDIFRHIINKSDGDVNFIQHHLHNLNESLDSIFDIKQTKLEIGEYIIEYDVPYLKHILTIEQHEYLSIGELENLERESLETGYRFIDSHLQDYLKDMKQGQGLQEIIFAIPKGS